MKGTFERFRVVLHDLGFHNNVALTARFSGPKLPKRQTHHLIFQALRQAIIKHPALSAIVSGRETPHPFFERLERIDLNQLVSFEELPLDEGEKAKRIDAILSRNHSCGYKSNVVPLWRVVVLEQACVESKSDVHLAFVWHHVIGDGRSGLAVLSTILNALNSYCLPEDSLQGAPLVNDLNNTIVMTPSKPLFPALEEILPLPMSTMTIVSQKLGPWLPSWFRKSPKLEKWSGSPYHCEEPTRTNIRHMTIPPGLTQALVGRCRSEATTITPFLQALVGQVLMETFDDAHSLRCAVALSLRRIFPEQLQIDDGVMGLWVNAFHLEYTRDQLQGRDGASSLWNQARNDSQRIEYEIAKGETDVGIGMLRYIKDFKSTLMGKMGKKREDSYAITNLGVYDPMAGEASSSTFSWQISDLVFSQSCHVNGSAIQFCIVSVKDGNLCIALSWQQDTVTGEDVARIEENLREKLLHLGSSAAEM